jgi:hypothetical protein
MKPRLRKSFAHPNVSLVFRYFSIFLLIAMPLIVLIGLALRPSPALPLNPTQLDETVRANVRLSLTAIAGDHTPTDTPDIQTLTESLLTQVALGTPLEGSPSEAPTPTEMPTIAPLPIAFPDASQSSQGWFAQILSFLGTVLTAILSVILSIWNAVGSVGGPVLQCLCCILIPVILVGLIIVSNG